MFFIQKILKHLILGSFFLIFFVLLLARIKTIGKNLTQFKKNFISLNQHKPRSQDHIIEDPMNATNKMEIPEKYEFLEVLGKVKIFFFFSK